MNRIIGLLCVGFALIFLAIPAFAKGNADRNDYTPDSYRRAVERDVGHRLDKHETLIADSTWKWYDDKQSHTWDREKFDYAVEQGVKNCSNGVIIAAAKTGKFGEKLVNSLVEGAGNAAEKFSDWVDRRR